VDKNVTPKHIATQKFFIGIDLLLRSNQKLSAAG